jgi:hypothetical protein
MNTSTEVKTAVVAPSVPNRYGYEIYYHLTDKPRLQRFWVVTPLKRKHWKPDELEQAINVLTQNLQRMGYAVKVVTIEEYMSTVVA